MRSVAADLWYRERSVLWIKAGHDEAIAAKGRMDVVFDKHVAPQV